MLSLSYGLVRWKVIFVLILLAGGFVLASAFTSRDYARGSKFKPPPNTAERWARVKTTGYCWCQECCNWHRSVWRLGAPVISSGPYRGRTKAVGVTASGTRARPGVVAADTNLFAMGTIMYIPGYGWGRVEDVGGAIKGYHIDLYFNDHATARKWGVRKKGIKFWRPAWQKPRGAKIVEK